MASTSIPSTRPPIPSFLAQAKSFFFRQTGDRTASQQLAWQQLQNLRPAQASSLAYFDSFWMIAMLTLVVAFLVLAMRRSVAAKGTSLATE